VADSLLGKLACGASHAVVMAFDARGCVENRAQAGTCIVFPFKLRLIEGEGIAGRLRYPITDALRAGSYR
jgi:hypothetical protein